MRVKTDKNIESQEVGTMQDKKALMLLKKYYLPYHIDEKPTSNDLEMGVNTGVIVPVSEITHDEMVSEIKQLSERIPMEAVAKSFLYSLSSGDMRYRTALSSLVWARSMPEHSSEKTEHGSCVICGCSHGLNGRENVDWNEYGVFRYLPPIQYGKSPDFTCAEYVLNDLREFEKLPAVEPCEEDYRILNSLFAAVGLMKSHNMDTALVSEIRRLKLVNATGNGIHCLLAILSICGILEGSEQKGFLHGFTDSSSISIYRDGLSFYPLFYWRGKDGVNYDAVNEIFGSFSGDKLAPDKSVISQEIDENETIQKTESKAAQYYTEGVYFVNLTNEERHFLALNDLNPEWETVSLFSVTYFRKKRTVLFFEGDSIVKVIHEEQSVDDDSVIWKDYIEYDTCLATESRKLLLPLTSRGRAKPITAANVLAMNPFGCEVEIYLKKNESTIWAGNLRNHQVIAIGEENRIKNIVSDTDFHEFMKYYISTCHKDYFERIAEIRGMKHQTVQFRAGDVFRCQMDRSRYTYGIIIGKTRELEKWKELPAMHSFRNLMAQPIIVRMFDFVTSNGDMTVEQLSGMPLRPPMICTDEDIIWGKHKIIAHKELKPDDVQFQIHLARQGRNQDRNHPFKAENVTELYSKLIPEDQRKTGKAPTSLCVEWGFVSIEIPWESVSKKIKDLLNNGVYYNSGTIFGISGKYCGKTLSDILHETPQNTIQYNLLLPENRDKFNLIMNALGLPDDCSYDDFALKYGGLSRQQYIELVKIRCK